MQIAIVNHKPNGNNFFLNTQIEKELIYFQNKINTNSKKYYFKNNFGKIYEDNIYFEAIHKEIKINEVAFLKIRKETDKSYNLIATILSILFISGVLYFQNNFFLMLPFLLASAFFILFAMFYKKHKYYVKIVLSRIDKITIKIEENQQKEVDAFTRKLAHYRQLNPDLKL